MNSGDESPHVGSQDFGNGSDEVAFLERVMRYQDGALHDAALAEFEAELRDSLHKRRVFAEIQLQAAMVRESLRRAAFVAKDTVRPHPTHAKRPATRMRWTRAVAAVLALCVIVAVIAVTTLKRQPPLDSTERGVALLQRTADVEWAAGEEVRLVGAALEPGTLRLKSGAALVEFYSGARVVVEGPAEFQLFSASEAYLRAGRISAHVPPPARGFTVRTAQFDVVDRGTEFGLAVVNQEAGAATTEVHVFAGLVEVQRTASDVRELETGKAIRLERDEVVELPSNRSAFLREEQLEERAAAEDRARFAQWEIARRELSDDPATVLHEAMTTRTIGHGSVIGCEWAAGRWPQKSALQFRRAADRVRIRLDEPLQQLTLLAWVRVDALSPGMSVLLAADEEQVGALNWLITASGQLRLEIGRDLGHRRLDWEAINSEAVVTRDRFGQWLLLATTFDGSTIRHFINGQPCGEGASFRPPAMHIGAAELGNGHGPAMRHLFAALDEFAIIGRAMPETELRDCFENGRP